MNPTPTPSGTDVHEGDAGPQDHHRRNHHVCRPARLHRPVPIAVTGCRVRACSTHSMTNAQLDLEHDGLLNKTIGDAVMAVFNFPLRRRSTPGTPYSRRAIFSSAGATGARPWSKNTALPQASWGSASAFTPVNCVWRVGRLAPGPDGDRHRRQHSSRAQSVARSRPILVTKAVFERSQPDLKDSPSKAFQLKELRRRSDFLPRNAVGSPQVVPSMTSPVPRRGRNRRAAGN